MEGLEVQVKEWGDFPGKASQQGGPWSDLGLSHRKFLFSIRRPVHLVIGEIPGG